VGGALSLLVLSAPAWADLKIGFVNYQRLMQESPQGKAVQGTLRAEFAAKQRELANEQEAIKTKQASLDRDGGTMSVDQRSAAEQALRDGQRELSEKQNEYQDDMTARQNQELSKLQRMLVEVVQQYAQAQHYDLILADGVIFANPTIDITQPVLASLQARGATATAPRSTPRSNTRSH
jgi:outer membrane protein